MKRAPAQRHICAGVPVATHPAIFRHAPPQPHDPALKRWLLRHPRFQLHFTPTRGSWLNPVERLFALLTEKQQRRGAYRSIRELEAAIRVYLEHHNRHPKPFLWTKSANQILYSVVRFCKRILSSRHYLNFDDRTPGTGYQRIGRQ
jgi:transposase